MTEQERVQKQFELKVNCLNDLLTKEMDKRKLLENQLAENLKRVFKVLHPNLLKKQYS
ncbi:hypothetical protein DY000_02019520 [Brassica cretica]|uniref:Uncharacterized protein n=1 Tax=Brassica cretica TaxID=69181 RepID=A0ABQ7CP96_BRACR|nr:hypothetical protein DY000_02019520 [Brassica cretica]